MGSNVKDILSTIFGIAGAVAGAVITVNQSGIPLPAWLVTTSMVTAAVSLAVIGWLTGKAPDGKAKTPEQVAQQTLPKE